MKDRRPSKRKNVIAVKRQPNKKPKTKRTVLTLDRMWFNDQLDRVKKSQAQVARDVGLDPGGFNRSIKGTRMFTPRELEKLSESLQVPHGDVLRALGINPDVGQRDTVPIAGVVNERLEIKMGRVEEPRRAPVPLGMPSGAAALRYSTRGTVAQYIDGWLAYYVPRGDIHHEAMGQYCVVHTANGKWYLRVMVKSHAHGTYCLVDPSGREGDIDGVKVLSAAPVVWIRC